MPDDGLWRHSRPVAARLGRHPSGNRPASDFAAGRRSALTADQLLSANSRFVSAWVSTQIEYAPNAVPQGHLKSRKADTTRMT